MLKLEKVEKRKDGTYPTAVWRRSVPYCVECFLKLPEKMRQGQGARNISWIPDSLAETVCCSKCQKTCVDPPFC